MTANAYLASLANRAIIRDSEKESIRRSIDTLSLRLHSYFGSGISDQLKFGSYTRGTILPRCMDPNSDVDYMVVFADGSYRPQTYLDKLRRFVAAKYSRSEIAQSHPTIVLNLNHIRFELVPAVSNWWGTLQIPAPASDYQDWTETDPNGFNNELTTANQRHRSLIKPLVRVVKYWNIQARRPFASYSLEEWIVSLGFPGLTLTPGSGLSDYFYETFEDMNAGWDLPAWKREAIERAKRIVREAEERERLWQDHFGAVRCLRQLLPEPAC
jgi:hypothetical protein